MKEGYKKTEIGVIPEDWEVKKLEEICSVKGGKRLPKGYQLLDEKTEIPYIRVADMYDGGVKLNDIKYVPIEVADKIKSYKISKDDLFISVAGTLGIVGMVPKELDGANLTENADKLCDIKINKEYLMRVLQSKSIQDIIKAEKTTSAQPKLALNKIREFTIPIPTDIEQKKIAEILSTVDCHIDDTEKLIEKCRVLKKGLMQMLLTKGIGHTEFKKTEIGEIPVGWEVKSIGECAEVTKLAGFEFTEYVEYIEDGEIIALRALNLKNGKLDLKDIKKIDKNVSENLQRSKLYKGNMLFSYVGTVGEVALIEENDKYHLAPNVAKLTFNEILIPEFTLQYFRGNAISNEINKYTTTTSQPALSMENIRKLKITIPPISEQEKIALILSSVDNEIEEYENKKQKLEELKKGLMQQLLTGKVRTI